MIKIANPFLDPEPEEPKYERFVVGDLQFAVDLKTSKTPTYLQVWTTDDLAGGYAYGYIADHVLDQREKMAEGDYVKTLKMCIDSARGNITERLAGAFSVQEQPKPEAPVEARDIRVVLKNTVLESDVPVPVPSEKLPKPLPVRFTRPGKQGKVSKHRIKPVKTNPLLAKLLGKVVQKD